MHRLLALLTVLSTAASAATPAPQPASPTLTRAEAAMILLQSRMPGNDDDVRSGVEFSDVEPGSWYERYVLAAERYGLLSPNPFTRAIRPHDTVNRAELLKMLTLTFGLSESLPFTYADVLPSDWFAPYAGVAQTYSLFRRDPDTIYLRPSQVVTHQETAEAVQAIVSALERTKENTTIEQQSATDQTQGKVQLYLIASTKRTRGVLVRTGVRPASGKKLQPVATSGAVKLPELRAEIVALVNLERANAGLGPLVPNVMLEISAQRYAEDMARQNYFSHVSPTGQTLKDRIKDIGYYDRAYSQDCFCVKGYALGENLARGQKTTKEVVKAWMKSRSHRAAILNNDYEDIGIGIYGGVWVQHFGAIIEPGELAQAE